MSVSQVSNNDKGLESQGGRMPTYFLSHGGGPWPWLTGYMRDQMVELEKSLQRLPGELPVEPKAILMVSGHWETPEFTVQTNSAPPMLYDYGGFPKHTYEIEYPASGDPVLAARVTQLLGDADITVVEDDRRGFDHGMYSVLFPAWPDANVPVVQLSVKNTFDPEEHLAVGRALSSLRDEGVLILGSGFTYHNLALFGPEAKVPSREFDDWLGETLIASNSVERASRLVDWESAPSARIAQPREDHLIPLMVVVGAAEDERGVRSYYETGVFEGVTASSFRFGI